MPGPLAPDRQETLRQQRFGRLPLVHEHGCQIAWSPPRMVCSAGAPADRVRPRSAPHGARPGGGSSSKLAFNAPRSVPPWPASTGMAPAAKPPRPRPISSSRGSGGVGRSCSPANADRATAAFGLSCLGFSCSRLLRFWPLAIDRLPSAASRPAGAVVAASAGGTARTTPRGPRPPGGTAGSGYAVPTAMSDFLRGGERRGPRAPPRAEPGAIGLGAFSAEAGHGGSMRTRRFDPAAPERS